MSIRSKEMTLLETLKVQGMVAATAWPPELKSLLEQFRRAGIVRSEIPAGKRSPYIVVVNTHAIAARLYQMTVLEDDDNVSVRAQSILKHADSKVGARLPYLTLMVTGGSATGWEDSNGMPVSWHAPSHACCLRTICFDERDPEAVIRPIGDVILVENKDVAINLPAILPPSLKGALVIHYQGWMSDRLLKMLGYWSYAKIWVFPDLDPVGFANIKRLTDSIPESQALIPVTDDGMFKNLGSQSIWKKSVGLVAGLEDWASTQPDHVQSTLKLMRENGKGLEQEVFLAIGNSTKWHLHY